MGRAKEVEDWFERYENPMKAVVMRMREIILDVDPRVGECIKWQAPTFTFEGNIASFFPKSKQHASLMFHQGAMIPGQHAILEGGGETGRFVKIASVDDANAKASALQAVIRSWIALREGPVKAKTKKTKTKKKAKAPAQKQRAKAAATKRVTKRIRKRAPTKK